MELQLTRTLSGCSPGDDFARGYFQRWPLGETRKANVRKPRAHKSLKRWWGLCNLVHANSDQFRSPDMVHDWLKIRAGHCVSIVSKSTGETWLMADSISYDAIEDEADFQDIWKRAVKAVSEEILGTGIPEIEAEIMRCCGMAG